MQPLTVVRFSAMGDIVLMTGVLEYWRRRRDLTFTVVTRRAYAPLFIGHPAVPEVVALPEDKLHGLAWLRTLRRVAKKRVGTGLVDLHGCLRSRLLSLAWKGPVYRYPKESAARRMYLRNRSQRIKERLEALNVPQRYAAALEQEIPPAEEVRPCLFLSEAELQRGRDLLAAAAPDSGSGRPLAAVHPYAVHPNKAWPRESWFEVVRSLRDVGYEVAVIGAQQGEERRNFGTAQGMDLSGKTDLRESAAVLAAADVLVTNDSGPMHLATAVGTPVVGIFGPTVKAWGFFPSGPQDRIVQLEADCRPCSLHGKKPCPEGRRCLTGITPESVVAEVRDLLDHMHTGSAAEKNPQYK